MISFIRKSLKGKSLGQAETPFILGMAIIFSFLLFIGASLLHSYPTITFVTGWDIIVFATSIVAVAAACAVITGVLCAAALVVVNLISFLTASNTILYALIFLPLSITTAYVTARLGRGGG